MTDSNEAPSQLGAPIYPDSAAMPSELARPVTLDTSSDESEPSPLANEIGAARDAREAAMERTSALEAQLARTQGQLEALQGTMGKLGNQNDKSPQSQWDEKTVDGVHRILMDEINKIGGSEETDDGDVVSSRPDSSVMAKAIREMVGKVVKEQIGGLKGNLEAKDKTESEYAQVRSEIIDMVGPAINDKQSPIYAEASNQYRELATRYGAEHVKNTPDFERLAVLMAMQKLGVSGASQRGVAQNVRQQPPASFTPGVAGTGSASGTSASKAARNLKAGNLDGYASNVANAMFFGG